MTTVTNPYEALYTNLKNRFTVIYDNSECTVGDYMRLKAGKNASATLPSTTFVQENHVVTTLINYMNDKLTLKNAPKKDETIKRFPIRTSMSALLSAAAACALVMSCGIFALTGANGHSPYMADGGEGYEYVESTEIVEEELENKN